jgi:hypothetical protein
MHIEPGLVAPAKVLIANVSALRVAIEPLVTYGALRLLKRHEDRPLVATCFNVGSLRLA